MDNDIVIFTASDRHYFPLCVDLIASIKKACGFVPRMRVLDVGLLPGQIATLASTVEKVIEPDWDFGEGINLPTWFRAMTARPLLPKYAGNASLVAWIDCDAWMQRYTPFQTLINAARDGRLAIVEERFGKGFSVDVTDNLGAPKRHVYNTETIKRNIRNCYENCFGSEIAAAFGDPPCFNSGVFALRSDSPSWTKRQEIFRPVLAKHFHSMAEQQALNVGIHQGLIPISEQPLEANYACHLELPWYSPQNGDFTFPGDESRELGIVHLNDTRKYPFLEIPQFPNGQSRPMPLIYGSFRNFVESKARGPQHLINYSANRPADVSHGAAAVQSSREKVGRNQLCPCGSGKKYKHCHGRSK